MRRLLDIRAVAVGTAVAAAASAASFALAVIGFGRLYYASVLLPIAMLGCVALAWFSFLRDDGLARPGPVDGSGRPLPEPAAAEPLAVPGLGSGGTAADSARDGAADGRLDPSLYAPRDGGLVPRRPAPARPPRERAGSLARAALAWAAIELGAAAAILYSVAGVGSRFY